VQINTTGLFADLQDDVSGSGIDGNSRQRRQDTAGSGSEDSFGSGDYLDGFGYGKCANDGVCFDGNGVPGYGCDCSDGWTGAHCDCKADVTYSTTETPLTTPCLPYTVCGDNEFESTPKSATSNRACKVIRECTASEFQVQDATETSNRQCATITICSDLEFQVQDATKTSNRQCQTTTVCDETEVIKVNATATSDRVCATTTSTTTTTTTTTFKPCTKTCKNGGQCVWRKKEAECNDPDAVEIMACDCNPNAYGSPESNICWFGKTCALNVDCEGKDGFEADSLRSCNSVSATLKSLKTYQKIDKVCNFESDWPDNMCTANIPKDTTSTTTTKTTEITVAVVEALPCGPVNNDRCDGSNCGLCEDNWECTVLEGDHECAEKVKVAFSKAGDADADKSASLETAGAIVGVIALLGVLIGAVMMKRGERSEAEAKDEVDVPVIAAVGATVLAGLPDRMWTDFRRCVSFDHAYFGNEPIMLSDTALEDVYALLAVPCPPRNNFAPLRDVGKALLEKPAVDTYADDGHAFVNCSIADVLVERAIDLLAIVNASGMASADDDQILEVFVEMLNNYSPADNSFLSLSADGRSLKMRDDAAKRTLVQAPEHYYEAGNEEFEGGMEALYSKADEVAPGPQAYAFAAAGDATYDRGASATENAYSLAAVGTSDPTYAWANAAQAKPAPAGGGGYQMARAGGDPTYDVGAAAPDPTYAMAQAGGNGPVSRSTSNALYAVGTANPMEFDGHRTGAQYATAQATGTGAGVGYQMAKAGGDPTYDVGASGGAPPAGYVRCAFFDRNSHSGVKSCGFSFLKFYAIGSHACCLKRASV
jgi:hypothetical protein